MRVSRASHRAQRWSLPARSVAVCTPFIELLAYTGRDKGFELLYVPQADAREARKIREVQKIGYCVLDEKGDPKDPAVVVVLGGLAMPKFDCAPEDIKRRIAELSGAKGAKGAKVIERAGGISRSHSIR